MRMEKRLERLTALILAGLVLMLSAGFFIGEKRREGGIDHRAALLGYVTKPAIKHKKSFLLTNRKDKKIKRHKKTPITR